MTRPATSPWDYWVGVNLGTVPNPYTAGNGWGDPDGIELLESGRAELIERALWLAKNPQACPDITITADGPKLADPGEEALFKIGRP